jgi:4'-phosphopantetheinyl transferase
MKEAYTKALGLGMGFDFRRIEYNLLADTVTIDGEIPKGWQMIKFEVIHGRDMYQGVTARFVGGDETLVLSRPSQSAEWLVRYDAPSFVCRAIEELK